MPKYQEFTMGQLYEKLGYPYLNHAFLPRKGESKWSREPKQMKPLRGYFKDLDPELQAFFFLYTTDLGRPISAAKTLPRDAEDCASAFLADEERSLKFWPGKKGFLSWPEQKDE